MAAVVTDPLPAEIERMKMADPKASARAESPAWPLAEVFGLREDGGWVDALKQEWEGSLPEMQRHWKELLQLCAEARPRCGDVWAEAEDEVVFKCGAPPDYVFDVEPLVIPGAPPAPKPEDFPKPGTDAYQQKLGSVAPPEDWISKVGALLKAAGAERFMPKLAHLCRRAVDSGLGSINRNTPNREILRGLIWCAAAVPEANLLDALRQLAIWSIEHRTGQAKTIGLVLASIPSEGAAAALRMIEVAAKKTSRKERFARYASHVEKRLGLSPEASAERFVPTFELDSTGVRKLAFGADGAAELCIDGSKTVLRYFNSNGKAAAAAPSVLKRNHAQELQELRATAKGLGQLIRNQRDRLESLFLTQLGWDLAAWRSYYLDHPVVGTLARRLIWQIGDSAALFREARAVDFEGKTVSFPVSARVRLWHPLERSANEVLGWRTWLENSGVTQPFKQAHREIYLLTDAERRTLNYSNRFAAHILRQSQFRALAAERGWKTELLGNWDAGDRGIAKRQLPGGWKVEFWLYGAEADEEEQHFQSRGMPYVSTDQVRFYRAEASEPSPLEQVPRMLFSEAMRDVDLFVGVSSVGNDPTWADGGRGGRHREYWHTYSLGALGASAKIRREVLERLVPKLNISRQCSFEEKFLVVKGSLRTYKIHLGSASVLMKPNDRYLCIVPDLHARDAEVLLPFEGDRMLSVILSKAFLLADDSKIKDQSILNQIKSK
jgi:hypothetical protein